MLSPTIGRQSHGLCRQAVPEAARRAYASAHSAVTGRCDPVAGKSQLAGLVIAAAVDNDFHAIAVPAAPETLLVLTEQHI